MIAKVTPGAGEHVACGPRQHSLQFGVIIRSVDCVTRTRYLPIPLLTCSNGTHWCAVDGSVERPCKAKIGSAVSDHRPEAGSRPPVKTELTSARLNGPTISLGTGLSCPVDYGICSSETICLAHECPLQTASDRGKGHAARMRPSGCKLIRQLERLLTIADRG